MTLNRKSEGQGHRERSQFTRSRQGIFPCKVFSLYWLMWPRTNLNTEVNKNIDRQMDGHHQSISRNCFAIRPKTLCPCSECSTAGFICTSMCPNMYDWNTLEHVVTHIPSCSNGTNILCCSNQNIATISALDNISYNIFNVNLIHGHVIPFECAASTLLIWVTWTWISVKYAQRPWS